MSLRYKGGVISATPPTTTGGESGTASGNWTLEQQMQAQGAGNWPVPPVPKYIEDVFQTWLYSGNSSTQTITNGIDLSGQGGLVWIKCRNTAGTSNTVFDTARGATKYLNTNATGAQGTAADTLTAFNSNGFALGADSVFGFGDVNASGRTYASWTFRKQPKFFDVVTFSPDGSGGATFNHNLQSTPGCVIIKLTSGAYNWLVYHQSTGVNKYLFLESTAAAGNSTGWISVSSTSVTVAAGTLPAGSYVAYLFAHNAGGFGLTGTDNVISCGSYSPAAGAPSTFVDLGWEPQWVLIKNTNITGNPYTGWGMFDNMRGVTTPGDDQFLLANSSNAESNGAALSIPSYVDFNATGFTANATTLTGANGGGHTYIYIAIRRGPMKTPTSGTSVFSPQLGTSGSPAFVTGFPTDLALIEYRSGGGNVTIDRLRGATRLLDTTSTAAESAGSSSIWVMDYQNGYLNSAGGWTSQQIGWSFRRAPGFFDEVCYTGTGSATTQTHNLGVVPELMIVKSRSSAESYWGVYTSTTGNNKFLGLNVTDAATTNSSFWNNTTPTASVFSIGTIGSVNRSGETYVAYLFASVAGVSKVGSYSGTGALQTINCGFTSGARFVLIKRTDSTGDWWVYDSARGITSGNDPYLLLNSTAAEVTGTNYVDTDTTGFKVTAAAPAGLNASGGTYIFLAIA